MAHIEDRWKRPGNRDRLRYRARYIAPDGRERSKSFARKADARSWLDAQESAKVTRTWTDPAKGRVLFADWFGQWQRTTARLRQSTEARDERLFRRYVLPRFGRVQLGNIDQLAVAEWTAELSRHLAPATVDRAYRLLSKVMRAAVDARMLAETPCRRILLPKIEHEEMRFLAPAEIARLADAIDPAYRALVLVAAYGGLRIGELAGLTRRRVDLDRGSVQVVQTLTEVDATLVLGPTKTRASRRTVSLPRLVVNELAKHIGRYGDPDQYVFRTVTGRPLRTRNFRHRAWKRATQRAGLAGLRIHDLRHTAVALWIAAGAGPKEVAARAGHTSVSFTLDRYGHLYPEADSALRDRLDAFVIGSAPGGSTAP